LQKGDRFANLEISDRSSLSDFFIQNFADEQHKDLEQIRSPFDNLFNFVEALDQVRPGLAYEEIDFSKLIWLEEKERKALFDLIIYLRTPQPGPSNDEEILDEIKKRFSKSKVWQRFNLLFDEQYEGIFVAIKNMFERAETISTCYHIAKICFGLSIAEATFRDRLKRVERGEPNYFFQNPRDMRAVGILIGNEDLEENFNEYNDSGRQVSTVLQQLGVSLARVIRNEDNPMNEMDAMIRQNVKFCEVL